MAHDQLEIYFSEDLFRFIRKRKILYPLLRRATLKDILESLGLPHTEVGRIEMDRKKEVSFESIPVASHRIDVYPITPPFDVTRSSLLRPIPFLDVRFSVDVNVGKLAMLLRVLGLDTRYDPQLADKEIAAWAEKEKRILLTKDTGLLKRKQIVFGRYIRAIQPDAQLEEVVRFFGLNVNGLNLFKRCLRCNQSLSPVAKTSVWHRLLPRTRKYYDAFYECSSCKRIYWRGSHHTHLMRRLSEIGIIPESKESERVIQS